jgi:hypothetical protein
MGEGDEGGQARERTRRTKDEAEEEGPAIP